MRLLIVEDEKIIREQLARGVAWAQHGVMVVGAAQNGEEGLRLFEQTQPDIVLADIRMPKMDGLQMLEQIRKRRPEALVIMLSAHDEFGYVQQALRDGAYDYVLKIAPTRELIDTVLRAKERLARISRHQDAQSREQALLLKRAPEDKPAEQLVNRAKRYIMDHCGLDLSLSALADAMGLNPSYLSQLFKSEAGMGFSEFTLKVRMEKARELLKDPNLRVRDVANLVGYQDEKYFTLLFKKAHGVTPSEFKRVCS